MTDGDRRPAVTPHDERTCPDCSRVIDETGGNYLPPVGTPGTRKETDAESVGNRLSDTGLREAAQRVIEAYDVTGWPAPDAMDALRAALSPGPEPDVERESFIAGARAVYGRLGVATGGNVLPSPGPEPVAGLDAERLRWSIEKRAASHTKHSRTHVRGECAVAIAREYAALSEASEPWEGS